MKDATQQRTETDSLNSLPEMEDGLHNGEAGHLEGDGERPTTGRSGKKPERAMAMLGRGRSVTVIGRDLTLDTWIKSVQEALAKARRAKGYGLQLDSFLKMLRDMSQR